MTISQTIDLPIQTVANESASARATFIRKTYAHLALALLAFFLLEVWFLNTPWIVSIGLTVFQGWGWILVLGGFILVTAAADHWAAASTSKAVQYLAMAVYVAAEALIFVPLIYLSIAATGDASLVVKAAWLTGFLFVGVTLVPLTTTRDFSTLRIYITVTSVVALGLIVTGILLGFTLGLWFSFCMIGLACGAILYQTSKILNHYHTEQYVAASLALCGAVLLLLWYMLNVVGELSGD